MRADHVHHLRPDGEDRVQVGHRILEDHGDTMAAKAAQCAVVHGEDVLAGEADLPAQHTAGRHVHQARNGTRQH
jgi:hypothetical protein